MAKPEPAKPVLAKLNPDLSGKWISDRMRISRTGYHRLWPNMLLRRWVYKSKWSFNSPGLRFARKRDTLFILARSPIIFILDQIHHQGCPSRLHAVYFTDFLDDNSPKLCRQADYKVGIDVGSAGGQCHRYQRIYLFELFQHFNWQLISISLSLGKWGQTDKYWTFSWKDFRHISFFATNWLESTRITRKAKSKYTVKINSSKFVPIRGRI